MTEVQSYTARVSAVFVLLVSAASCSAQADPEAAGQRREATTPQFVSSPQPDRGAEPEWAGFRGPGGMGVSGARDLPTQWSDGQGVIWKAPLPGAGASSPVVVGERIFLTAYSGYFVPPGQPGGRLEDLKRHVLCLRRSDGKLLWDQPVPARLPEEERIRDHGYAANTPAADAERLYVFLGKSGVFAFDHDGKQLWQADVGSGTSGWGTAASPLLYKDLVIINASVESQSLVALDRATGQQRWRADGIKESWNTPILVTTPAGDLDLVVAGHGHVFGFDPDSGRQRWSCETDISWYMVPCGVAADGIVYFLGGRSGTAALAVRTGGQGDVTGTHRLWTSNKGSNVTSPVYHNGHLYWAHESRGIAYCARAATGEIVYEERLPRAGQIYSSALLADGRLYYLNRSGRMFVVAAKPDFQLLSTNDLPDRSLFNASPVVMGQQLLLRSDTHLYCIGKQ